jgi:FtsP/CotA-like multicopper oxidase with cupredoxin domain
LCAVALVTVGARVAHADTVLVFPIEDASIYSESNTLANGLGQGVFSGRTNDGFDRRALLEFDVANVVPPFSTVTSVELRMHVTQSNTGPLTVGVHRLTTAWGEGPASPGGNGGTGSPAAMMDATWSERFFMMNQPWATPGGDFVGAPSATTAVGGIGSTFAWSSSGMVADVQAWLDNPTTNHGWILVSQPTASGQAKRYASRSEIWRFINKSGLAHPMHMHLVMFRVLDRQPFTLVNGQVVTSGPPVPPIETERGYKDTVRVDPNEIVRVVARFENYVGTTRTTATSSSTRTTR